MSVVSDILRSTQLFYSENLALQWVSDPAEYTYSPNAYDPAAAATGRNTGISVRRAVAAHIECRPAMQEYTRTFILVLDPGTFVSGEEYEIDIESVKDGDRNVIGQGLSVEAAASDLADNINAAYGGESAPVAQTADLGAGRENSVIITQRSAPDAAQPDMILATVTTQTTAEMAAYSDAASCSLRIWAQRKRPVGGLPTALPMIWAVPGTQGGLMGPGVTHWDWGAVPPTQGVSLVRDVRSYDRLYVELYDVTALSGSFAADVIFRPYLVIGTSIPVE